MGRWDRSQTKPLSEVGLTYDSDGVYIQEPSRFLSRREVADLLHISPKTVDRYRHMGLIPKPAIAVGRRVRWLASDIAAHQARISTTK